MTLRGLGAAADRLALAPGPDHREAPAGWLLQDRPGLFRAVRTFGRSAGADETAVAASLFGQAWAVSVTRAAIACLVGARRVPDMGSSNTILLFEGAGRPTGATLVTPRYAAVAAYLLERAGDLNHAAELYAEAARTATSVPERDHLTREAARVQHSMRSQPPP